MPLHAITFATPVGPFSAAVNEAGALVATAFGDLARLRERLPADVVVKTASTPLTAPVVEQVTAYFTHAAAPGARTVSAGKRPPVFKLTLAPAGTAFQQAVWAALAAIPWGQTRSYGQLAAALGRPSASRAVGRANATNPICLIVPCHRVIGANGSLTGFAFGNEIKRSLLLHEGALT